MRTKCYLVNIAIDELIYFRVISLVSGEFIDTFPCRYTKLMMKVTIEPHQLER